QRACPHERRPHHGGHPERPGRAARWIAGPGLQRSRLGALSAAGQTAAHKTGAARTGGPLLVFASAKAVAQSGCTASACRPFWPCTTSNDTCWPSCRLLKPSVWMARKWTNTSSPFSRLMKPKPLASLNHLTVPVCRLDIDLLPGALAGLVYTLRVVLVARRKRVQRCSDRRSAASGHDSR